VDLMYGIALLLLLIMTELSFLPAGPLNHSLFILLLVRRVLMPNASKVLKIVVKEAMVRSLLLWKLERDILSLFLLLVKRFLNRTSLLCRYNFLLLPFPALLILLERQ